MGGIQVVKNGVSGVRLVQNASTDLANFSFSCPELSGRPNQ